MSKQLCSKSSPISAVSACIVTDFFFEIDVRIILASNNETIAEISHACRKFESYDAIFEIIRFDVPVLSECNINSVFIATTDHKTSLISANSIFLLSPYAKASICPPETPLTVTYLITRVYISYVLV